MLQNLSAFFTRQCSSFTYLNVTQFLGALNDNVFKLLIVYFLIDLKGDGHTETIMATAGAIFVIPFLLFSATSGTLADRWSKRNIIVSAKFLEVLIMATGIWAFQLESPMGAYLILFLMATQSAYFGPSKYGIVPELVTAERISKANGLLSMFTFLAIIIGTFLASFVTDITGRNFLLGAFICTLISAIGFWSSLYIAYTPPAGSTRKLNALVPYEIYQTLQGASKEHGLLTAIFGSAFMMFIGAFFQLNIIPFAMHTLQLSDVQGGYLFLLTAVGIGTGSVFAGKLSGRFVELGLVPFAGLGIALSYFALDHYSHDLTAVVACTLLTGIFGGIFIIPMDSFIQVTAPSQTRGQVVAAANVMGFLGVLCASAVLYFNRFVLGVDPDKGFTFVGVLTLVVLTVMTISFVDYFVRFLAMLASRVMFQISLRNHERVPTGSASILISNYSSWYDSILIMGTQRRAIHLYLEGPDPFPGRAQLANLLRILPASIPAPIEKDTDFIDHLITQGQKGVSSCIFIEDHPQALERMETLQQALKERFKEHNLPTLQVQIVKSPSPRNKGIQGWLKKFREPATVSFTS